MKKLLMLLLVGALFASGCGVSMSAEYRRQLDLEVELAKIAHNASKAGDLTDEQQTQCIGRMYILFRLWQDSMTVKGVPTDPADREAYVQGIREELE